MSFILPPYTEPDFTLRHLKGAPLAAFVEAERSGIAPDHYHATSIYPEYFKVGPDEWRLAGDSRMDSVVVREEDGSLTVKEFRHLRPGDRVAVGRRENGEDGIYVHTDGFGFPGHEAQKFAFRTRITRGNLLFHRLRRALRPPRA